RPHRSPRVGRRHGPHAQPPRPRRRSRRCAGPVARRADSRRSGGALPGNVHSLRPGAHRVAGARRRPPAGAPVLPLARVSRRPAFPRPRAAIPLRLPVGAGRSRNPGGGRLMRYDILSGIRVVELGSAWAGPFAARLLADLGAEVIKVEAPRRPDFVRFSVYLDDDPGEEPWERGAHYQKFSRNKKSCIIDVQTERGRELFLRLLSMSDVFIENNTPRVRQQLG